MPIITFQKAVGIATTAEQVSTDTAKRVYIFRAHPGNGGTYMYIGGTNVAAATGLPLGKADINGLELECRLSEMWVDTDNSGDKLCVLQVID